jgi:hypothetical protein
MRVYIEVFSILFGLALAALVDSFFASALTPLQKALFIPAYFLTATKFYLGNVLFYSAEVEDTGKSLAEYGFENVINFHIISIEFGILYYIARVLENYQLGDFRKLTLGFFLLFGLDSLWLFIGGLYTQDKVLRIATKAEMKMSSILFVIFFVIVLLQPDNLLIHIFISISLITVTCLGYYFHRYLFFRRFLG